MKLLANVNSFKIDYTKKKTGEATITLNEVTLTDEQTVELDALTKLDDFVMVEITEKKNLFNGGNQ